MTPETLPQHGRIVLFGSWIASMSDRLVNCPIERLDGMIAEFQQGLGEQLDLDRSAIWECSVGDPDMLLLTFFHQCGESSFSNDLSLSETATELHGDLRTVFPWIHRQVRTGDLVIISSAEQLPEEAAHDRSMLLRSGTHSAVALPLVAGGEWLGCITMAVLRETESWSEERVRQFRLVGNLLAHALARKRASKNLAEWRTIFDAINHAVVVFDSEGRVIRENTAASLLPKSALAGTGKISDPPSFEDGMELEYCPIRAALELKRAAQAEFYDEIEQRWFRQTVHPLLNELQSVSGAVLTVEEITEKKQREEKLRQSLAEIQRLRERVRTDSEFLTTESTPMRAHGLIISQSRAIRKVLYDVEQVAPTDSTVLICGETGTGKELIAEAIHRLSPRKDGAIIKVNCAALPQPLVESELFGREKGAYTGALARQAGRFEAADNSSIFLDEIGELSLDVQAKLLRVLQEGQFERLGSPRTIKVNVRLIVATNRDLAEEVRKGRFRQDLYYRLNVFPIKVPPLRERPEDIALLVWAFVEEFSARMGKKITNVPRKSMDALQNYSWPGNIRELRNVVERSMIISSGDTLRISQFQELEQTRAPLTLEETEREHILRILEKTMWHIKGPNGAAGRLGVKPSTLYSRMQKLGIPNRRQKDAMQS
jgi:formate hydrogenlyase transcriptional activator